MGNNINAIIEASDTYFVIEKTMAHMAIVINKIFGAMTAATPSVVATPLPPLNFRKTGHMWPQTADNPMRAR